MSVRNEIEEGVLGAVEVIAKTLSGEARAAEVDSCVCLETPDCNALCGIYGGVAKSDGSQSCICNKPPHTVAAGFCAEGRFEDVIGRPDLSKVATTGKYSDLLGIAPRAASDKDGGNALNTIRFDGKTLRLAPNDSAVQILSVNGQSINYIAKSDLANGKYERIGEKQFTSTSGRFTATASRDEFGRLTAISLSNTDCNCDSNCNCTKNCNCNCNCCNCGDDSAY